MMKTCRIGMVAPMLTISTATALATTQETAPVTHAQIAEDYGKLPLHFEANRGQTDTEVKFLSHGPGYTLFLTPTEAVLALRQPSSESSSAEGSEQATTLRMQLSGANPNPSISGIAELSGKVNYLHGHDPAKWRTDIPTYARVEYSQVYPGIDLVYYGNQQQLEYDFVVAPGADPNAIRLNFAGADKLDIDAQGDLVLHAKHGEVRFRKPVVYQEIDGKRREVDARFAQPSSPLAPGKELKVGFQIATYDKTRPLVIDPVLNYSTYLGGSGVEVGRGIAVDSKGNAYVIGTTYSTNLVPRATPSRDRKLEGTRDAFIAKLDPSGRKLLYATYLGGSGHEEGYGIAVDGKGNAYVTGTTTSSVFPTTAGAWDRKREGGRDAFIAKLDPNGKLSYSTYLGGNGYEYGQGIAIDKAGNAYVTGTTYSSNFVPATVPAYDRSLAGPYDAFVAKLNPNGAKLIYATYLGGSRNENGLLETDLVRGNTVGVAGIAVDDKGNAYVTGTTSSSNFVPATVPAYDRSLAGPADAFIAKLNSTGTKLLYATYLGGDKEDLGHGIAVDRAYQAYVTGTTYTHVVTSFPVTDGALDESERGSYDAFVAKLDRYGRKLVYAARLGGESSDGASAITIDGGGNSYVTGSTRSFSFPTTPGALDSSHGGGDWDAFIAKLDPNGKKLLYSTYLGASGIDGGQGIALDRTGSVYVTGESTSSAFPTTLGALDRTR